MSGRLGPLRPRIREPRGAALAAGLAYVAEGGPGIRRRRAGTGWSYTAPDGRTIRDPAERARIRALAIPPAWRDVWICPDPRGHIQATGRDAKGRKQYRYHAAVPRRARRGEVRPHARLRAASCRGSAAASRATSRRAGLRREKVLAARRPAPGDDAASASATRSTPARTARSA